MGSCVGYSRSPDQKAAIQHSSRLNGRYPAHCRPIYIKSATSAKAEVETAIPESRPPRFRSVSCQSACNRYMTAPVPEHSVKTDIFQEAGVHQPHSGDNSEGRSITSAPFAANKDHNNWRAGLASSAVTPLLACGNRARCANSSKPVIGRGLLKK